MAFSPGPATRERWRRWRAAVLTAGAVLSGCAAPGPLRLYEGPARPAADVARVTVPEAIEVISVNGAQVAGARGLMRKGEAVLELAPGRYELLAYYREVWELPEGHDALRSDPVLLDVDARAGGRYRVGYARPAGYEAAQQLAGRFGGWVEDESTGARTPSRDSGLQFRRGFTLGEPDLEPAAARREGGAQPVAPLPAPAGDRLQQLKALWQQADPQERREFRQWLEAQP